MANTVEYYKTKGFDDKTAAYFSNGRRKIVSIKAKDNFTISIMFDNGEKRLLDMSSLIKTHASFKHFANPSDFQRAYLDSNSCISWDIDPAIDSNKVWNNKVDLDPDWCYMESVPN